jgi:hypothetical protein
MNLQEIKDAVENGQTVHVETDAYRVVKDHIGQWFIHCTLNDHYIGLTWTDKTTLNGKNFYVKK